MPPAGEGGVSVTAGSVTKVYPGASRVSGAEQSNVTNHSNRSKNSKERAVLVTTAHRGVFFGYATETDGETIKLRGMRNCIQWRGLKGFLELASDGPGKQCRIGPAAEGELRNITGVWECSPKAVDAWESAPWSK